VVTLLALALSSGLAMAQKKTKDYVALAETKIEGSVTPGARVTATLHFKIKDGYHTQSNKPSEEYFIPTVLKMKPAAGIKIGKATYPKGHSEKVTGIDKPLSVYDKEFRISVPVAISSQAKLPATVEGTLNYQACQGSVCYPPQKLSIELKLE
jgi:hypothetical protein